MELPHIGRWESAVCPMTVNVSNVTTYDNEPNYYLVSADIEGDTAGLELDPEEWNMFVKANRLRPS